MSSAKEEHFCESLSQTEKVNLRKLVAKSENTNCYRVPKCIEAAEKLFLDFKNDINFESVKRFGFQLIAFHRKLQIFKAEQSTVADIKEVAKRFEQTYFHVVNTFYHNPCARATFYKIFDMLMHEYYTALRESQETIKESHSLEANTSEENPALLLNTTEQFKTFSKERNNVSEQLKNISEQLDVAKQLKGLSKERVDILKQLQDISKERIDLENQLKNMANDKQNITEQLTNISEQLGKLLKEKNDLSDLLKNISKEMSRERYSISEQHKKLSEFFFNPKNFKQPNESTIIKEQKKSHALETTPTTSPTQTTSTSALCTCALQMASNLPSHILRQQCNEAKVNTTFNEKSSIKYYNELLETYSVLKEQDSGQYDIVVFPGSSLPPILLNACFNIFTQWRAAYSQTELTIFFTTYLRNLNSNLFLECATELAEVKTTTSSNSSVVDKKWSLILSGALKQWLSSRIS